MTLDEKLEMIREVVDIAIADDIDSLRGKGAQLAGVIGLSAECKKEAKEALEKAKLKALLELREEKLQPSVMMKMVDGMAAEAHGTYVMADRINAAVTHQLDYIRSLISYEKQERIDENNARTFTP